MRWSDVRIAYPNQWLVIEALDAHSEDQRRFLDRIGVVESCEDGAAAMACYSQLHRQYPQREFYFVHTDRETLDILESRSVSTWRTHAVASEV